jgi:poly(hydroxyalkanoate) granule-associated protein
MKRNSLHVSIDQKNRQHPQPDTRHFFNLNQLMEGITNMAKRMKAVAESSDVQLAETVRNSAQQIWQAGLGALMKAQREGGDAFAKLVKDGAEVQHRTQQMAEEKFSGVALSVARIADNLGKQAAGSWEKFGSAFEDRVSRSLHGLGIPSQNDIHALTKQIADLNKSVNVLLGRELPAKRKAATLDKTVKKTLAKASKKPVASDRATGSMSVTKAARAKKAVRMAASKPEVGVTSSAG